jgi:hypothetical protein
MTEAQTPDPLELRDCAFTAMSTGEVAIDLRELLDRVRRVSGRSLYYHFWRRLLRPVLRQQDYVNDLANWVGHELRDTFLAERLALIDPGDETDIETLRKRILGLLEERLADHLPPARAVPGGAFHFVEGQMVIFDTGTKATDPADLARLLPTLPTSTVYYHFIDARHRPPTGTDDFQRWLQGWGDAYTPLVDALASVDVYFTPLPVLHEQLVGILRQHTAEAAA